MLKPMLASLADAPLEDPSLVYEPKYDGIRAIAEIPANGRGDLHLWSRLGNDKAADFHEIAEALRAWARSRKAPVVLDGEMVALDPHGNPAGFQHLQRQGRWGGTIQARTAFIAFDVLHEGTTDYRNRPLLERRAELERIFSHTGSPILRLSEIVRGSGRALYERALASGWEGLIAKRADSPYVSGKRTPDWRKLKILQEQEFVIGGWTEPRQTRTYFGALLIGTYQKEAKAKGSGLVYAGHIGTGFNEKELARLMKLLRPLETEESPFEVRPKGNERVHWVKPKLVAQVKFTEWTADGSLRHPVYLGLRDDKKPEDVVREPQSRLHTATTARLSKAPEAPKAELAKPAAAKPEVTKPETAKAKSKASHDMVARDASALVETLREMEAGPGGGTLQLPGGAKLSVTNLRKIFWPRQKLTKGDLFRYYAAVAPFLLPAVADRPLVMKRYPNGIAAKPFYQHRADDVPAGVRVEDVKTADGRQQIIGGDLLTLMYMTQLASISQDPWFSRVETPQFADYVALDLDPPDGLDFARVLDVARWIHDELELLGAVGVPKTSGSDGLHVYLPLPPETPYGAGQILCQIIATVVVKKHPKQATLERTVKLRGKRIYVDYMQNAPGKTLATAYSARASEFAGVSTPLTWKEVERGVKREDFTITSAPERFRTVGDLWAAVRTSKGIDFDRVARYAKD